MICFYSILSISSILTYYVNKICVLEQGGKLPRVAGGPTLSRLSVTGTTLYQVTLRTLITLGKYPVKYVESFLSVFESIPKTSKLSHTMFEGKMSHVHKAFSTNVNYACIYYAGPFGTSFLHGRYFIYFC